MKWLLVVLLTIIILIVYKELRWRLKSPQEKLWSLIQMIPILPIDEVAHKSCMKFSDQEAEKYRTELENALKLMVESIDKLKAARKEAEEATLRAEHGNNLKIKN